MNYYKDIADIIKSTNSKKSIHPKKLTEIFYLIIEKEDLKDYVNYLCFSDSCNIKRDTTGIYMIPNKMVFMYNDGIEIYRKDMIKVANLNGKDLSLFLDEAVVSILLHELEHVKQLKYLSESTIYDSKYEILKASNSYNFFRNYLKMDYLYRYYGESLKSHFGSNYKLLKEQVTKFDNHYTKFYDIDPSEINAEYLALKSTISINDLIHNTNRIKSSWLNILTNYISNLYLDKHNQLRCPLEKFLEKRNKILTLDKVSMKSFPKKLSLDERISLAMPIKGKEYDNLESYFKKHL